MGLKHLELSSCLKSTSNFASASDSAVVSLAHLAANDCYSYQKPPSPFPPSDLLRLTAMREKSMQLPSEAAPRAKTVDASASCE